MEAKDPKSNLSQQIPSGTQGKEMAKPRGNLADRLAVAHIKNKAADGS
jgi:hypothetical protein